MNHLPDNVGPFRRKNTGYKSLCLSLRISEPIGKLHIQVRGTLSARVYEPGKIVYDDDFESSSGFKDGMQDHGVGDNGMMRIRRIMSWAL